jgi:WD40 repeat protein
MVHKWVEPVKVIKMKIRIATILFLVMFSLTPLYAQRTPGVTNKTKGDFRDDLQVVLGDERARTWGLPTRLEIDPNRNRLYLTESFGEISVFDSETLRRVHTFAAHSQRCLDVALLDDGKQLVSVATDGDVRLWDLQAPEPKLLDTYSLSDSAEPIWLKISRAFKSKLFAVRSDKQLGLFEIKDDKIVFRSDARARNKQVPYVFGLSPDGRWLVTSETLETSENIEVDGASYGYSDAKMFLWDLSEQKPKPTFITNCKAVERLYFLNDSQFVTEDPYFLPKRKSQTWSVVNAQLRIDSNDTTTSAIFGDAAISADGLLKAITSDGKVVVLARQADQWIERGRLDAKQVFSMAFLGDDLITCSGPVLRRWRWQGGKYQETPPPIGHSDSVATIDFDRDGRSIISTSDADVFRWSVTDGKLENLTPVALSDNRALNEIGFAPFQRGMLNIKSEPAGNRVLEGRVFDKDLKETSFRIDFGENYRDAGWCAAVHPTKAIVATGHWDSKIRVWDIEQASAPKMLFEWQAHTGHVCDVAFSPDGSCIASVGWDHQTEIWNIDYDSMKATAGLQLEDKAHTDILRSVAYSPSGKFLASGGEDGLVLLWDLTSSKLDPTVLSYPEKLSKSRLVSKSIGSLQYSKAEDKLLTASGGGRVTQWDTSTGQITHSWQLPGWIWQARYSPDEKTIATANNDGTVYLLKNPLRQ